MRLTINGEPIEFSLENERTLGDVMRGVQSWLAEAGFHITGISADARDLSSGTQEQWGRTEVSSVAELAVLAAHTGDMKVAHWKTVERWLGMLEDEVRAAQGRSVSSGGSGSVAVASSAAATEAATLSELLSGFPVTLEGMRANPFLPPGSTALDRFEALFTGQAAPVVAAWPSARLQEAAALIAELRQLLARRLADASDPVDALKRCTAQIRESMAKLPEVSILLQTGKDKAAMEIVIGFADVVQSLLGMLPFLPPDANRGKLLGELTPFLRDLVSAFDAKDSVLIGDLLEYEITPRIQRLAPVLEQAT